MLVVHVRAYVEGYREVGPSGPRTVLFGRGHDPEVVLDECGFGVAEVSGESLVATRLIDVPERGHLARLSPGRVRQTVACLRRPDRVFRSHAAPLVAAVAGLASHEGVVSRLWHGAGDVHIPVGDGVYLGLCLPASLGPASAVGGAQSQGVVGRDGCMAMWLCRQGSGMLRRFRYSTGQSGRGCGWFSNGRSLSISAATSSSLSSTSSGGMSFS